MSETAIEFENVHKYYGQVHALRGLDLQVRRGEIFAFLGPNGAGKTTAIRCMLDLIRPNHGRISIFGIDPQKSPQEVKHKIGYLPGDLKLEGDFTVRSFLVYIHQIRNDPDGWQTALELAGKLDLELDQKIKNLSQGNRQKVGLIQSLMSRAPLLLLDEPTLGLDPLVKQEVFNIIQAANGAGATVFFSSHILSEVQEIANRVGIIRRGSLVEIADTKDLVTRSLIRVTVHFKEPVSVGVFTGLPNIRILWADEERRSYSVEVAGDMDPLIKTLAGQRVRDLEINRPSLEEIFLKYYQPQKGEV